MKKKRAKRSECFRGDPKCCVAGDTRILTPMGMERIDSLYRLSKSRPVTILTKINGALREVAVREVHTDNEAKELFKVTLDDGCHVTLTGYHGMKWWCSTWRWLDAGQVAVGEEIDGRRVKSIERINQQVPPTLYDLELCEGDGYIANGIMVRSFVRETVKA